MRPKAAVIGAGPVGCLTALGLQQRGYEVIIYESRTAEQFAPQLNEMIGSSSKNQINGNGTQLSSVANSNGGSNSNNKHPLSRSINLAISVRGLTALEFVDPSIAEIVLNNSVPMYGRMIHHKPTSNCQRQSEKSNNHLHVKEESQAYSTKGDAIHSVSRLLLSRLLLDETVNHGIEIRWGHKLQNVQFSFQGTDQALLIFEVNKERQSEEIMDMVIGCDGHHSRIRKAIENETGMKVIESSIDNHYSELHIPAKDELPTLSQNQEYHDNRKYAIDPNHLHIWPRHDFMLIALANKDGSFTSTIFAPQRIYDLYLREPQSTIAFFHEQFPDALQLIGEESIVQQISDRKPSPLGMVRCQSYHAYGQAIILGDSAHAMVPFYGQGLNCGLEDVRIFLEMLDDQSRLNDHSSLIKNYSIQQKAFQRYSASRHDDLMAINDLALANFEEMSSNVVQTSYLLRKKLDSFLLSHLPNGWWSSLYMNVTFSNQGYHSVRQRERFQTKLLHTLMTSTLIGSLVGVGLLVSHFVGFKIM